MRRECASISKTRKLGQWHFGLEVAHSKIQHRVAQVPVSGRHPAVEFDLVVQGPKDSGDPSLDVVRGYR